MGKSRSALSLKPFSPMFQHPVITVGWALRGLETAIGKLSHGPAERRVRDQFHQLFLALERDRLPTDIQQLIDEQAFSLRH